MRSIELLRAVADGNITRTSSRFDADYVLDGVGIGRLQLSWLKKAGFVDLPMSGPPRITEDGLR